MSEEKKTIIYDSPKSEPTDVIYVDTDNGVKALDKDTKRLYDVEPNGDLKTYTDEKGVKRYTSDDVEVHEAVTFDPEQMAKAQRELEAMQERNNAANTLYDWQRINDLAEKYNTTVDAVKEALRIELGQNERNVMADLGHANADRIYSTEIGLTDPNLPGSGYMTWVFGKKNDNATTERTVPAKAEPKYGINTGSLKTTRNEGIANNTQQVEAGNIIDDKTAAAAYAYNIRKGEINHIFHNDFYSYDPVPAWSFSVDFIPCTLDDPLLVQLFPASTTMTLTKAVQKITANDIILRNHMSRSFHSNKRKSFFISLNISSYLVTIFPLLPFSLHIKSYFIYPSHSTNGGNYAIFCSAHNPFFNFGIFQQS